MKRYPVVLTVMICLAVMLLPVCVAAEENDKVITLQQEAEEQLQDVQLTIERRKTW